jgi:hypothetical protein
MKDWLMTPHNHNADDAAEVRYNVAHKRTRRLVENAFGILKERFPCLNMMRLNPRFAGRVVMACATLHNITTKEDFYVNIAPNLEDDQAIDVPIGVPANGNQRLQELLQFFR